MLRRRCCWPPGAAAVDRCLCSAANPPQDVAAVARWDRQTDGGTHDRFIDPAASGVNKRSASASEALYAVVACLSVRPSVTSRYCIEKTGRIEQGFLHGGFFPPIPHYVARKFLKKNKVSPKITVLSSGTLSQTPDFEYFAEFL